MRVERTHTEPNRMCRAWMRAEVLRCHNNTIDGWLPNCQYAEVLVAIVG